MMSSTGTPLTLAQESIFFLNDLTNGRPVYHMPQAFRLRGPLRTEALQQALSKIVARHEALRTAIVDTPEGPRQLPGSAEFHLARHQVSEQDLPARLSDCIAEPFDLRGGKPFRADLFRLSETDHVLLLNLHHALGDMSSLGILFRDLSAAYSGFSLEAPVTQNTRYAARRRTAAPDEATRTFWRSSLKDYTADLELPLDRPRPRLPSFAGEAIYRRLPDELTAGLKQLARAQRCSLYMVCLAALEALIFRYTGQQKFSLATPFSDRDDSEYENTIGYLINLLPLRCDVAPEESFEKLLQKVRGSALDAYGNSAISFREILKELNLASDGPKPPLAKIVFQHFPETPRLELEGLSAEQIQIHSHTSKFDLCFSLFEQEGAITAEVEYDSDLFTAETADGWARHYETILRSVLSDPRAAIAELNLVPEEDRVRIAAWNNTAVAYPRDQTVHALFEEQAARAPHAIALLTETERLSYRELNERANAVANELQARGVRRGDYVGVCLKRSPQLIAALLGILKAGAAFVPFESNYPKSRLEYLFEDSGVRLLITDSRNARIAPAGMDLLLMSGDAVANFHSVGAPENVAYVMYTSGSTGNPKGVMVPHRAIVRLVKNNDFCSLSKDQVWLAFAPVSFDASTLEIWAPLLNGGTLAIYPPEFQSVDQFEAVLEKLGVTSLWLTAGLFNTIVDQKVEALRDVKQLLVGGDTLSPAHVRKALDALPATELINGYGPTENTTFTCCYSIPRDWPNHRPVPIGKPIRNTRVHILDERMRTVPVGVPGDLYAAGDGLSLGYLNKPDLTSAAFLTYNGERVYRTGDRARYLADGTIEFLGRRDTQVKIRGFRIELGEIETALRSIPGVRDAAVAPHSDRSGGKQLAAYVVPEPAHTIDPSAILRHLEGVLPPHACPSVILPLSELPLGPNGKVNRAALPLPGSFQSAREHAAPENAIQERLIEIWKQILEIPNVSLDDNFFHCGGESLRATRAISQINRAFNTKLTLPRLFEAPTVRQMARVVEHISANSEVPIRAVSPERSGALPIEVEQLSDDEVEALLNQLIADAPSEPAKQTLAS